MSAKSLFTLFVLATSFALTPANAGSSDKEYEKVRSEIWEKWLAEWDKKDAEARKVLGEGVPERKDFSSASEWHKALREFGDKKANEIKNKIKELSLCLREDALDFSYYSSCSDAKWKYYEQIDEINFAVDTLIDTQVKRDGLEFSKKHPYPKPDATIFCDSQGRCDVYFR